MKHILSRFIDLLIRVCTQQIVTEPLKGTERSRCLARNLAANHLAEVDSGSCPAYTVAELDGRSERFR